MTQSLMSLCLGPSYLSAENAELPEAPRFLFIRASLESAQAQGRELRRLAKSMDPADKQQAVAILQSEAIAAPENQPIPACWGRPNAAYWLQHTEADAQAFTYSEEELYIATVFCSAELQVSRDIKLSELELLAFCRSGWFFVLPPCSRKFSLFPPGRPAWIKELAE